MTELYQKRYNCIKSDQATFQISAFLPAPNVRICEWHPDEILKTTSVVSNTAKHTKIHDVALERQNLENVSLGESNTL